MIGDLNLSVTNISMNQKLHRREAQENFEDLKEIVDRHTKEIDELKAGMGGSQIKYEGNGVDVNELSKIFAGKNPPDNTLVRIEELERFNAEVVARVINHDKTLYQNSTLGDLVQNDSKGHIKEKVGDALRKDRVKSATGRSKSPDSIRKPDSPLKVGTGVNFHEDKESQNPNLDLVFEEIENLNNNDYCLTTRIQTLEKMLAH
jgi:hypothetical protein